MGNRKSKVKNRKKESRKSKVENRKKESRKSKVENRKKESRKSKVESRENEEAITVIMNIVLKKEVPFVLQIGLLFLIIFF